MKFKSPDFNTNNITDKRYSIWFKIINDVTAEWGFKGKRYLANNKGEILE